MKGNSSVLEGKTNRVHPDPKTVNGGFLGRGFPTVYEEKVSVLLVPSRVTPRDGFQCVGQSSSPRSKHIDHTCVCVSLYICGHVCVRVGV